MGKKQIGGWRSERKFLISFLSLLLFAGILSAACPSGMIGYWKGDGNATDSSGSNNNGAWVGGIAAYTAGKVGQAFSFNGNTGVDVPDNDAFTGSRFTAIFWIKFDNYFDPGEPIIEPMDKDANNGVDRSWVFLFYPPLDVLQWYGWNPSFVGGTVQSPTLGTQNGVWYQFAAIYNGTDAMLYRNGVLIATQPWPFNGEMKNGVNPLEIGHYSGYGGRNVVGAMDEVAVFNRALSATDISDLYNKSLQNQSYCSAAAPPACPSGMLGYWKGEGDALDSSGNNNNGQLMGGATFSVPVYGSTPTLRSELDTAGDTTSIDTMHPIEQSGSVTKVEIYAGSTNSFQLKIFRQTSPGTFTQVGASETLYPSSTGVQMLTLATPISVQAGDLMGWYIPNSGQGPGVIRFGYGENGGYVWAWGNQASIINGSNLVSFVDRTYSIRVYLSGQGGGKVGSAFSFDGIDDYISTSGTVTVDNRLPVTMEMWVKPTALGGTFLSNYVGPYASGNTQWVPFVGSDGRYYFHLSWYGLGGITYQTDLSIAAVGEWQHVAFVANTTHMLIYVDGDLKAQGLITGEYDSGQSVQPFYLGCRARQFDDGSFRVEGFFSGLIDEVAVYNRALPQSELQQHFNNGQGKDYCAAPAPAPTCPTGMVSYWRFDEGSGTTASDLKGINPGTLHGATWANGIMGSAIRTGGGAYVEALDSPSLNITGKLSVELWVKADSLSGVQRMLEKGGWPTQTGYTLGFDQVSKINWELSTMKVLSEQYHLPTGSWHHVVGVYDYGASGTNAYVYVDGVQVSNASWSAQIQPAAYPLHIGCGTAGSTGECTNGLIDEVAIYNRVLTLSEIIDHYNGGTGKDYCAAAAPSNIIYNTTGGTVTAAAGNVTIEIPPGVLNTPQISVTVTESTHSFGTTAGSNVPIEGSQPYDFGPEGTTFIAPVTVTLKGDCSAGEDYFYSQQIAKFQCTSDCSSQQPIGDWPAVVNCAPETQNPDGSWGCTAGGLKAAWYYDASGANCKLTAETMSFSTYAVVAAPPCTDGQTQSCYTGPAGTENVGICSAGTQTCTGGQWGACTGDVTPGIETCNNLDDNCNGQTDDVADSARPSCSKNVGVCSGLKQACNSGQWVDCTEEGYHIYSSHYRAAENGTDVCWDDYDNDCNGVADAADPNCQPGVAALPECTLAQRLDLNGDGSIDVKDAMLILRNIVSYPNHVAGAKPCKYVIVAAG